MLRASAGWLRSSAAGSRTRRWASTASGSHAASRWTAAWSGGEDLEHVGEVVRAAARRRGPGALKGNSIGC
eukprot:14443386-Alexandrium_andersonii.AAC.1